MTQTHNGNKRVNKQTDTLYHLAEHIVTCMQTHSNTYESTLQQQIEQVLVSQVSISQNQMYQDEYVQSI